MKRVIASLVVGGAMVLGAQAYADDTASNSTSMTNSHEVHKKLMKQCMDQQKGQNGSAGSDARKACEQQVKTQMTQMNDAGTIPPSGVPKGNGSDYPSQSDSAGNSGQ